MTTLMDIITADKVNGGHFFDESTMRGFKSKVYEDAVFEGPGGIYFVTSERFTSAFRDYREPRKFTIRQYNPAEPTHHKTVGEFQQYAAKTAACRDAARLAGSCTVSRISHIDHIKITGATGCTAQHIAPGGHCLNCGWNPK